MYDNYIQIKITFLLQVDGNESQWDPVYEVRQEKHGERQEEMEGICTGNVKTATGEIFRIL